MADENDAASELHCEELIQLQADVDDESPQVLAAVAAEALRLGALDAHMCPLLMKKGRPGTRVEILCAPEREQEFARFLIRQTSTLGVKARSVRRYRAERRFETIVIEGFEIRCKVAMLDGESLRAVPEFEDAARAAGQLGRPVREILEAARAAALQIVRSPPNP